MDKKKRALRRSAVFMVITSVSNFGVVAVSLLTATSLVGVPINCMSLVFFGNLLIQINSTSQILTFLPPSRSETTKQKTMSIGLLCLCLWFAALCSVLTVFPWADLHSSRESQQKARVNKPVRLISVHGRESLASKPDKEKVPFSPTPGWFSDPAAGADCSPERQLTASQHQHQTFDLPSTH